MSRRKIKKYDKEFKQNAVNLCLSNERHYREIAKDLGVAPSTLGSWIKATKKNGTQAFPGKGHLKQSDIEITQLRKELTIIREERDILKKALGIFSSPRK